MLLDDDQRAGVAKELEDLKKKYLRLKQKAQQLDAGK